MDNGPTLWGHACTKDQSYGDTMHTVQKSRIESVTMMHVQRMSQRDRNSNACVCTIIIRKCYVLPHV